jgi:hypothetical protein
MAINKNHLFEDLDGVKCAVVEAGVSQERVDFLKPLLEGNGFTVIVVEKAAAAVKTAAAANTAAAAAGAVDETAAAAGDTAAAGEEKEALPALYTIGVTDVSFNSTNAIYGRLLRTREGNVVTMAYWLQKEQVSKDEVPYFDWKK